MLPPTAQRKEEPKQNYRGCPSLAEKICSHVLEGPECVWKPQMERDVFILVATKLSYLEAQSSQKEDDYPNVFATRTMP